MAMLATSRHPTGVEIGVDEAGYGAFYGRVYAAAVVWPRDFNHPLIRDSKTLSARQREEAYQIVLDNAICYGVAYREAWEIDTTNVRVANIQAMHEAISKCHLKPSLLLIDGIAFEPYLNIPFELVVKGDGRYAAIAAASILAKVSRDHWILDQCAKDPTLDQYYCLSSNKGYGATVHRDGLANYGWTNDHRKRGFSEKYVAYNKETDTKDAQDPATI